MIDTLYSREEMDVFLAILRRYRDHFDDYVGGAMSTINREHFTHLAERILAAHADSQHEKPQRPPSEKPDWIRIQKTGADFRVQAEDSFESLANTVLTFEIGLAKLSLEEHTSHPLYNAEHLDVLGTIRDKFYKKENTDPAQTAVNGLH